MFQIIDNKRIFTKCFLVCVKFVILVKLFKISIIFLVPLQECGISNSWNRSDPSAPLFPSSTFLPADPLPIPARWGSSPVSLPAYRRVRPWTSGACPKISGCLRIGRWRWKVAKRLSENLLIDILFYLAKYYT